MRRPAAIAGLATIVVVALAVLLAAPAMAAYPGENGKIAFVRGTNSANDDIYTINPDGTGATQLTPPTDLDRAPSWSPSGDRIAFHRMHTNGDGTQDVYTANADGTAPTNLTPNTGVLDAWPTWSPDGSRIAFVSTRHPPLSGCGGTFNDRHDVYLMNQDGSGPTRLTANRDQESQLSWSPRGDEIALHYLHYGYNMANGCDPFVIDAGSYTVDPATGARVRNVVIGDWSPDGSTYASSRQEFSSSEIFVGETNVTNTPNVHERDPAWSPDGRQIVFSTVPFPGDLWVMDADGSDRRQLTATSGVAEYEPDWQPLQRPYARPAGATPMRVSLVPAFAQCTSENRVHGPPLAFPSCNPPQPASPNLVVSDGEQRIGSLGWLRAVVVAGVPGGADDAGVRLIFRLTNVRNASDLSDYTGILQPELGVRLTDRDGFQSLTTQDFPFRYSVPCVATDTAAGATCALTTSAEAIVPGSIIEGSRAIWALDKVRVYDGGPSGDGANASLFATQGIFVP